MSWSESLYGEDYWARWEDSGGQAHKVARNLLPLLSSSPLPGAGQVTLPCDSSNMFNPEAILSLSLLGERLEKCLEYVCTMARTDPIRYVRANYEGKRPQ